MTVQLRRTKQKDAIRAAFLTTDRPLSPDEVLACAQKQVSGISIATVYRNIAGLVEEQWLIPVQLPGETARYEVAGKAHHHHFRCTACDKIFEMPGCSLEYKPLLPRGFRVSGHEFFLFGTCAECH